MARAAKMGVAEAKNGPVLVLVARTIAIDLGVVGAIRQGIGNQTRIWTQLHHAKGHHRPGKVCPMRSVPKNTLTSATDWAAALTAPAASRPTKKGFILESLFRLGR